MYKLCLIKGCGGISRRKGYCDKHYQRFRKYGSPYFVKLMKNAPIFDRIMSKVAKDKKTGCWNFIGNSNKFGYGIIGKDKKTVRVHRMMYEHYKGKITDGLCVCHSCDNPRCCNPEHLWVGTRSDNNKDMNIKGRSNRVSGSKIGASKLTEMKVLLIKGEYCKCKGRQAVWDFYEKCSVKYGVSPYTIKDIILEKTWKHI